MATLTIRNVDEDVVKELKKIAKQHGRSLEAELRRLVTETAERQERRRRFLERIDRTAAMTPKGVKQTDSALLLREDRDR